MSPSAEELAGDGGEKPRLCLSRVAQLASFLGPNVEGLLSEIGGVHFVPGEAVGE